MTAVVRAYPGEPLGPVSRRLFGHFGEHIDRVVYGGLWAELLVNRKFELPGLQGRLEPVAPGWHLVGDARPRRGTSHLLELGRDAHHQQIVAFAGNETCPSGIAQRGVVLDAGTVYKVSVECSTRGATGPLRFALADASGSVLSSAVVALAEDAGDWHPVFPLRGVVAEAVLESPLTTDDGMLSLTVDPAGAAELWLHWVSLLPEGAIDGLHPAIVDVFRELPANLVKYPGGCFADNYDWRLGVGPRHDRHGAPDTAWGGWDENDFGTDEFLRWCELTNTEPYLCVNHGSGTPELAAAWVDYCNGPASSRWGRRRAEHGHPEPYAVGLWAIGNEVYGPWERGASDAASYAKSVRAFADAMRSVDPSIRIVAQGDLGDYSADVLRRASEVISYLSVHHYASPSAAPIDDDEAYVAAGRDFENRLRPLVEQIRRTRGAEHVRLALDEWGWVDADRGNCAAAFAASVLAACVRLAPYVEIGALCCLVNPGGAVQRIGEQITLTPAHSVMRAFNDAYLPTAVRTEAAGEIDACAFTDGYDVTVVLSNATRARQQVALEVGSETRRLELGPFQVMTCMISGGCRTLA